MTQQETQQLLADLRELIADREREGIRGLAERVGPHEWAELIPELEQREIATLIEWLPDSDIPELLADIEPEQAAVDPAHSRPRHGGRRSRGHGARRRRGRHRRAVGV